MPAILYGCIVNLSKLGDTDFDRLVTRRLTGTGFDRPRCVHVIKVWIDNRKIYLFSNSKDMDGGKRTTKRTSRKKTGTKSKKTPAGYRGSIRVGDTLKFYQPQHGPVKTKVTSIRKTKNKRFQAQGKAKNGTKLFQFVSGNQ